MSAPFSVSLRAIALPRDEPEPVMSATLPDESVYVEHLLLRTFHRLVLLAGHGEQARRAIEDRRGTIPMAFGYEDVR